MDFNCNLNAGKHQLNSWRPTKPLELISWVTQKYNMTKKF